MPVRSCSSSSRSRMPACTVTSRATGRLVGDQQLAARRPARWRSARAGACRRRAGAGTSSAARRASGCAPARSSSTAPARAASALPSAAPAMPDGLDAAGWPIVGTGLSAVIGSCGISATRPAADLADRLAGRRHVPAGDRHACPERTARSSGSSRRRPIAVVDLPEPDSPMMVTVSPASMVKLTPSTARIMPASVISSICRSRTSSKRLFVVHGGPSGSLRSCGGCGREAVAEQVDADHQQHDDQAGQGHQPPRRW